ncbi:MULTISPECIES: YoaP domain-containing protein [unclassified Clostridium]|nr:hypothetical protein [Clostridium botulinum]
MLELSPFTTYSFFFNGKFVTNEIVHYIIKCLQYML